MNSATVFFVLVIAIVCPYVLGPETVAAKIELFPVSHCLSFQLEVDAITNDEDAFRFLVSDQVSVTQTDALLFSLWEPAYPRDSDGRRFPGEFAMPDVLFSDGISRFRADVINGTSSVQIPVLVAIDGYAQRGNYSTSMRVRVDSIQFGVLDESLTIAIVVKPSLWTAYLSTVGGVVLCTIVTAIFAQRRKELNLFYLVGPLMGALTVLATVDKLLVQYPLFGSYLYLDWTIGFAYGFASVASFDKIRDWAGK